MKTQVAIVGAGLAGLTAARLLHAAGADFRLIEARERLGGRILTVDAGGRPADDGFDLGPSWYWPQMQPAIGALVEELGLPAFGQSTAGDVVFERMSRERPHRYRSQPQDIASMRLAGGTSALVRALSRGLPGDRILVGAPVTAMALNSGHVALTLARAGEDPQTLVAQHVIAALPPRLLASQVTFAPAQEDTTVARWRDTATWMAPHAKFFALYETPFWRPAGLSGTAQSMVGPLAEIHDATTASGHAALFGFLGVDAGQRAAIGEAALTRACIDQLARLFGDDARAPRATILKDWATDPWTATAADRIAGSHPLPSAMPWVSGPWRERLVLAGSETSPAEPGYLAGAVIAATRAVDVTLANLRK